VTPRRIAYLIMVLCLAGSLRARQPNIFDFGRSPRHEAPAAAAAELTQAWALVDALAWVKGAGLAPDAAALKHGLLTAMLPAAAASPAHSRAIADAASRLADDRIAREDFAGAVRFISTAEQAARSAADPAHARAAATRAAQVRHLQAESVKAAAAMEKLRSSPEDADARLTVGRFYCLTRGLFDRGLRLLAGGADAELQSLARRDLDGGRDAEEALAIGNAWWDYSERLEATEMTSAQMRAAHWYRKAVPRLAGQDKETAEKRIAATPANPPFPPPAAASAPILIPGPGGVVSHALVLVTDDFVLDIHHNGKPVPAQNRKLLNEVFGAQVERVTIELRPGDWIVFNPANNRLRWNGQYYFACAGLDADGLCAFTSETTSGQWSAIDDVREVPQFIASRDHLRDQKAQRPARQWGDGDKLMLQRVPDFKGEAVWGGPDARSTWVKFVVPE
jgi:hypothetical protein